jgi:hypothetical protein
MHRLIALFLAFQFSALAECQSAADALSPRTLVDLSHAYDAETVYWPTASDFELKIDFRGETAGGYHYEANSFCTTSMRRSTSPPAASTSTRFRWSG